MAEQHGRHPAGAVVGPIKPFREVPFFWTNQFGQSRGYRGHADQPDEVIVNGDAAAGLQRKADVMALMELMRRIGRPSADGVRVDGAKALAGVG